VLHKNTYHGWQSESIERGNETSTTYLESTRSRRYFANRYVKVSSPSTDAETLSGKPITV
jgi:hypothetical protein